MLGQNGRHNAAQDSQGKARLRTPLDPNPPEGPMQGQPQGQGKIGQKEPDIDPHGTGFGPRDTIPSPESQFGGQMNRVGQIMPPMPNPMPNPAAGMAPQPNQLPAPSPRALTGPMFGRAGGLLGGGLGVAGNSEQGSEDPTELLALIASLFGR